ncbi:hypothetical protein [Changpingibacter yushuensis]|uniref:hypothetical protein n=1 Tax=Changpingibacter yushuensis TaxID=2758440 RepID=UPI001C713551|nr:hypothetical protein [Changpingibacter yushuensis]
MLSDVVGWSDDGSTPLSTGALESDGSVVAGINNGPPIAIADPASPGQKSPMPASRSAR